MRKVLIILGNGFDLDLGLKTRYVDFWKSRKDSINNTYWERLGIQNKLLPHIAEFIDRDINYWGDLEEVVKIYSSVETKLENHALEIFRLSSVLGNSDINREYFEIIKQEMVNYLEEQQNKEINKESKAANFLRQLSTSEVDLTIYNFNYTNINEYFQQLNVYRVFNVNYIHGNLKEKNVILGVGDYKVHPGYEFLLKQAQGAKISSIEQSLIQAEKVIFFGVSFSDNDFHYFKEYFSAIKDNLIQTSIDIYTKDEESIQKIYHQIEKLGIKRRELLAKGNLDWKRTTE